jgi:enoyl-CoA hydratase/carnithine racemase
MGEFVRLEVEGGVGTIRLDRPPMNAISDQLRDELHAAALEATRRADVRAVVITGGEKVFAAGADIKQMATAGYVDMVERAGALQATLDVVARIPKPVIAAISGYALGGGCELALTADFRVCGDNAKLGQPEILLGVIPGAGGTQRLARLIGPARTKDLVFTGRFVGAEEALRIGLVDRVVAPDDVDSAALEMARKFVAGPALALRAAKAAIDGGLDGDLASGLRLETELFTGLFATEDQKAGMASFIENGPGKAEFTGR